MTLRNFLTFDCSLFWNTPLSKRSRLLQAVHLRAKTSACLKKVVRFFHDSLLSSSSYRKPLTQMTMCLLLVSALLTLSSYSTLHLSIDVSICSVLRRSAPNNFDICLISYLSRAVRVAKAVSKRVKKKSTWTSFLSLRIDVKILRHASRKSLITCRSLLS